MSKSSRKRQSRNSRPAAKSRPTPAKTAGAAKTTGSAKTARTAKPAAKVRRPVVRKGMSSNLKLTLVAIAVAVAVVAVFVIANRITAGGGPEGKPAAADILVRPDSHKLSTAADGKVTLVEFLDFECEACRAVYPSMERLRKEYNGKITFVVRYFPIGSHRNAELAARAVEAAADQGKFEGMYTKMYDNQKTWGEKQTSQQQVFEGFARDLGLDMAKFQAKLTDPATAERVRKDQADGESAGVSGTPTIFLNGQRVEQPSYESLKSSIDAALKK